MERTPVMERPTTEADGWLLISLLVLIVRIALGITFVVASIDKIADPGAFAQSILNYKLVSLDVALVIATVLPWLELLCGLGILAGVLIRGSALLLFVMLVVFTALVVSALARGLDISCGCFTWDPTADRIGLWKIGENALLVLGSVIIFYTKSTRFSLEHYFRVSSSGTG